MLISLHWLKQENWHRWCFPCNRKAESYHLKQTPHSTQEASKSMYISSSPPPLPLPSYCYYCYYCNYSKQNQKKSTNSFMHAYQEKRLYRNIEVRKSWITRNLWFLVRNRELTVGMELKRHLARIHLESVVSKTLREILAHSPRKPWLSVTEDYKGSIHDLCPDLAGILVWTYQKTSMCLHFWFV